MRLICPNCGAQYEVDDSLIPDLGRDVQCSNCGHAWFQRPAHYDSELSDELGLEAMTGPAPASPRLPDEDEDEAPAAAEVEAREEIEASIELSDDLADEFDDDETAEPDDAPAAMPQRAPMDDSVRSILTEEGDREAQARRDEGGLETQEDLGLEEGDQKSAAARERIARLRGLDVDERAEGAAAAVAAATAAGSRRDLLPDIEEINSSLRSAEEREDESVLAPEDAPRRRSGFGLGFMIVVLVAALMIAVYIFADRIVAAVPASEGAMAAYVQWADGIRNWLDGIAQDWVQRLGQLVNSVREDRGA